MKALLREGLRIFKEPGFYILLFFVGLFVNGFRIQYNEKKNEVSGIIISIKKGTRNGITFYLRKSNSKKIIKTYFQFFGPKYNDIDIGDSIFKASDSFVFELYDKTGKIKEIFEIYHY